MKKISILLTFVLICTSTLISQPTGTVKGDFKNFKQPDEKLTILFKEVTTKSVIQKIELTDGSEFVAHDLPFASYIVEVYHPAGLLIQTTTTISSSLPVTISFDSLKNYSKQEIDVSSEYYNYSSGGRTFYSTEKIESMPSISAHGQIETVLLNSPGVVPDEDGRLHVRGEDAQLQYVVDGIPITNNQTRVYASLFNAGIIKTLDFQRGGINPEYGVSTAGVMNIITKSGFDAPYFANAYADYGSLNSKEGGLEFGGNLSGKEALYLAYNYFTTDRYLDPIVDGDPIHDNGKANNLFAKFDALLSQNIDLVALGSYSATNFYIPNSTIASKQNQQQTMTNYTLGLRLNAELSDRINFSILGYNRKDRAQATSNGLNAINSPADSLIALNNEKFFIGGDRSITTYGTSVDLDMKLFERGTTYIGAGGEYFPLKEYFTFAVTNPNLSNPYIPGGDSLYKPYDITQGGRPFLVNQSLNANRMFAYIEQNYDLDKLKFQLGLRYDYFHIFDPENNISGKIAASYTLLDNLILRLSYNRTVMMAPLENILVSSSLQADTLTGAAQEGITSKVQSEKSHVFEIGGAYLMNKYLSFDIAGYAKLIDDFLVKVELGNSGVIFPANLKQGFVAGGELQIKLNNWNNFSGFLNFSTITSLGLKPSDGTSPIAAGLIIGEEGHSYNNPFPGEDMFQTEHNQLLTATFNLVYNHPLGYFVAIGGRFDSGLPFDLADSTGKGLDEAQSRIELKKRGYSDKVIDMLSLTSDQPGSPDKSGAPHATFDLAIGSDLRKTLSLPFKITASVTNIFNTDYLIKFESTFGGTHFGTPRMLNLKLDFFLGGVK